MSRIRSIHPRFWTDEAVVSVSRDARLLYIGLWTECDDKGAFEWKPLSLKMRLFPADGLDVIPLLGELTRAQLVKSYVVGGQKFGAIKNFLKYQRPKKPNDLYPMPDSIRAFSKAIPTGSEPVENRSEKVESDGGGRREKEDGKEDSPPTPLASEGDAHPADAGTPRKGEGKASRANGSNPRARGANPRALADNLRPVSGNPHATAATPPGVAGTAVAPVSAAGTGPPTTDAHPRDGPGMRNGFIASAFNDLQQRTDHADGEDPHRDGSTVVPITRRADCR
jgi:hypothetical protein